MPAYDYHCTACGDVVERLFDIGTAARITACDCGGIALLMIGRQVNLSEKGFVSKGDRVREADGIEDRWSEDIPAYKRMRRAGLQPPSIDGAADLEETVGDQADIDFRNILGGETTKERIGEISEEWALDWPNQPA
jgi:putative FmdB family regulatory protein